MMKIIYVVLLTSVVAFGCSSKKEEKAIAPAQQVNEYPPLVLKFQDGEEMSAKDLQGKNVFIMFQPDCSHCQEEAVHIEQRLDQFKDYTLYFISSSPMDQIMAFGKSFNLANRENVKFAWTSSEGVLTYYGPIQTPSIYIYSKARLRQKFNGQTEIDTILAAL